MILCLFKNWRWDFSCGPILIWSFFWKLSKISSYQIFVVGGLTLCSISDGFIFGQMSGMIDALQRVSSAFELSEDDISTIAATINITCFWGFACMAGLTEAFGRRISLTVLCIPVIICWIMVYFAQDKIVLIASRAIVGLSFGGITVITYINVGEYVAPHMRSLCLNIMYSIGTTLGTMLGHVLCLFMHWRNVALVGLIPTTLSAIIPLFWVESPSWLATHNRLEECEQAFYSLHPHNEASEKELKMLLDYQINNAKVSKKTSSNFVILMKKYKEAWKQPYYWKIVILTNIICLYRVVAGKILLSTLIITIIQDITGTNDILAYTVVVDGFALIGAGLSCIGVTKFNMRSLLFCSGIISNTIQTIFAASLYFWKDGEMAWVKISLLALYYITVTAGPYSVLETLLTELHPLEIKTMNCLLLGTVSSIIQFTCIQFATKMFTQIGYHGVFFVNSAIVFLCLLYLYFQLPETKGRTLQEIEYYFKNNTFRDDKNEVDESERLNKADDSENKV